MSARVPLWSRPATHRIVTALVGAAVAHALGAGAPPIHGAATRVTPARRADTARAADPIARLQAQLDAGTVTLPHDSVLGYLPAVLAALDIPVSSQTLVFSRTSLQTDKITPWSPRALYFNDDVYVGYVLESHFLEIGAVDPVKGGVFYTLSQTPRARSNFERETTTCLMCHSSRGATGGVPGFMVLSTITDRHGYPITGVHEGSTTDVVPLRQRFGGWYVTGKGQHAGNVYAPVLGHEVTDKPAYRARFTARLEPAPDTGRTSLAEFFDTTAYISGQSDVVALMVLTHQTTVHNLIMATQEAAREALLEAAISSARPDSTQVPVTPRLRGAVDNLVRAMLFAKEGPLNGPVRGSTTFTADFQRRGVRDRQGRSLREFDLETRLFRYPCSFLIHSDAFAALPLVARRAVYARIRGILEGTDPSPDLQYLSRSDREALTGILEGTIPEYVALR